MTALLILCIISNHEGATALLGRVYFNMPGTDLIKGSETVLKTVADKMQAEPNLMIDVYGYTYGRSQPTFDTSMQMAGMVKKQLADNFGILSDRIQTQDYRVSQSFAQSIDTIDHWVDIMVRQPDAILAWFDNDVKVQPPTLRPNWLNPLPDYYLYHGYKIATGKKSSAHILYPGKGMLRMDEDAMVIIHSLSLERKVKPLLRNIRLQDGSLTSLLKDVSEQTDSVATLMTTTEITYQTQDTLVAEKLEDLVVVYQRNAEVADLRKESAEQVSEGVFTIQEDTLGEPINPPAAPILVSPRMKEIRYYPNEITFVWQPSGVLSHLQVAEDSTFQQISFDAYAASDSLVTSLTDNLYYWRVSGINEDSLEGDYADYWTFVVEIDTLKPILEIAVSQGQQEKQLIAIGHTEVGAALFINDTRIKQADDGSFIYKIPDDYHRSSIVARAVDDAGNITEKSCKIPGSPLFVMGVNAGVCLATNKRLDGLEKGFWYGVRFSRMLLPSFSIFTSTAIARSNGKNGDTLNMTDIAALEIGFRKNFHMGRVSPFLSIQTGIAWSQMSTVRQTRPGIINYSGAAFDPTLGFGVGSWFHAGGHWYLNLHAEYTHIFRQDDNSGNAKTFTKIGFGIQDRKL
ncbi:MAG: hypothetical protein JSV53_11915 [candidate division WOR-3 bacterium]|nr:MAG: hypothetical protein JSV53_11915 [candidate division WOR-3 bacterium]